MRVAGDLNLLNNQLQNHSFQKVATLPSTPFDGQVVLNTSEMKVYMYDSGAGGWWSFDMTWEGGGGPTPAGNLDIYTATITDWVAGTFTLPSGWSATNDSGAGTFNITHGLSGYPVYYDVRGVPSGYPSTAGLINPPGLPVATYDGQGLSIVSDNEIQITNLGNFASSYDTIDVVLYFKQTV